jgi:hypothetical protein
MDVSKISVGISEGKRQRVRTRHNLCNKNVIN